MQVPDTSNPTERRGICGLCAAGCWVKVCYDRQGRMTRVEADDDPRMGTICRLGEHAPAIVYSPHRVLHPLRRTGDKGGYDFERIGWDDAYDIIRERLLAVRREHGPQAAAIYTGVGTFERSFCDVFQPKGVAVSSASSVLFPYGSPNTMGVGALCYVAYGMIAPHLTCGKMLIDMFNELDHADLIVVWGTNPATDLPPVDMDNILRARARGAEVVVIDPRRTRTAREVQAEWIPIRPGTDGALALGLCQVLIEEDRVDEDFAENWTRGYPEFARYVQHFRPEEVEGITGVPAATVRRLARRLAAARGASQLMYTGLEYSRAGVQAIRASLVLWALAGQLDVPGGRCFQMPGSQFPVNRAGHVPSPAGVRRLGQDRFPVYHHYRDEAHAIDLPRAVLEGDPYRVHALIIQGASMITSWPNPSLWNRTLGALDFLVCIDRQLTADAAWADLVLPAATYFEIESYMTYGPLFRIRERLIEPQGEARSDVRIAAELARHLGYGHLYPQSEEELLRHVLEGSGFTLDQVRRAGGSVSLDAPLMQYRKWEKGLLRPDGRPGFDTPSGKLEIASTLLEEHGYEGLPVYTEPEESPRSRPDLAERFPLVFNSGSRHRRSFHTQHHGITSLNRGHPEPGVTLNDRDAEARGIRDGDLVRISTPRGSLTMRARVTPDIAPGAIDADHACGGPVGPAGWRERNVNQLTDLRQFDPVSGFPAYKCLLCQVEKEPGAVRRTQDPAEDDSPRPRTAPVVSPAPRREVYLDHNATTPLDPAVRQTMCQAMEIGGNPSSIHAAGRDARDLVATARRRVARNLGCTARRVIFCGGGSEAVNLAIKGAALAAPAGRDHLVTSSIEHPAVLGACTWLERRGWRVTRLPVDGTGRVDPDALRTAIDDRTGLVSIMTANNETGVIQPVFELAAVARERGVVFHSDGVQAFGKIPVDVSALGVDLLSVSAHKLYGPKGMGALYLRRGVEIEALVDGGGQEHGLRGGTENLPGIAGFGRAAGRVPDLLERTEQVAVLRDRLEEGVLALVDGAARVGDPARRLANTASLTLPGLRGESLVLHMSRRGVFFSSGSACRSGTPGPSGTLLAMGLDPDQAHCTVRFSLGVGTSQDDVDHVLDQLGQVIRQSKSQVHFYPCR